MAATISTATHTVTQFAPGTPTTWNKAHYTYYHPPHTGSYHRRHCQDKIVTQMVPNTAGPNAVVQYFSIHPGGYASFPNYFYRPTPQIWCCASSSQRQTMDPKKWMWALEESEEERGRIKSLFAGTCTCTTLPLRIWHRRRGQGCENWRQSAKAKMAETNIESRREASMWDAWIVRNQFVPACSWIYMLTCSVRSRGACGGLQSLDEM